MDFRIDAIIRRGMEKEKEKGGGRGRGRGGERNDD